MSTSQKYCATHQGRFRTGLAGRLAWILAHALRILRPSPRASRGLRPPNHETISTERHLYDALYLFCGCDPKKLRFAGDCAAVAQTPSHSAASKEDVLSFDQKVKISKLVAKQTAPLTNPSFSVAIDGVVPSEIQLHPLPSDAEELAPQLRGFGYIVVEELVAIVDPRTRKVEIVFPR